MQLTRFDYSVSVEAECQEDADKIIAARIGHDEDLSEDGVDDYRIYTNQSWAASSADARSLPTTFGESVALDS